MEVEIPIIGVIFLYLIAILAGTIDPFLGIAAFASITALLVALIWGATSGTKAEERRKSVKKEMVYILDNFDVVDFLERHHVDYDEWLKSQIFKLLGEIKDKVKKL